MLLLFAVGERERKSEYKRGRAQEEERKENGDANANQANINDWYSSIAFPTLHTHDSSFISPLPPIVQV